MAAKTLFKPSGITALRKYLQDELPSLIQSPVMIISSGPGDDKVPKEVSKKIGDSCQLVQFTLAQQMGLRTVPSTVSSAFPTLQDLEERRELLRRTGAFSIVAVGSGAAMDLAKAMEGGVERVILVPSTYGGILASGTSHSLLLDPTEEETLVPRDPPCDSIFVCPLDANKYMAPTADPDIIINACLAIVLDACYRQSTHPLLEGLLVQLDNLLDNNNNNNDKQGELSHESAIDLLYQTGNLVSFGLGRDDRSSPLALAASLIPRIFPHVPMLRFYASLVPGLCHVLSNNKVGSVSRIPPQLLDRVKERIPSTSSPLTVTDKSLEGFSVPDMALSHIQSNQTVWKSFDLPDSDLITILEHSIKLK